MGNQPTTEQNKDDVFANPQAESTIEKKYITSQNKDDILTDLQTEFTNKELSRLEEHMGSHYHNAEIRVTCVNGKEKMLIENYCHSRLNVQISTESGHEIITQINSFQ